jgi:hypothetical protein
MDAAFTAADVPGYNGSILAMKGAKARMRREQAVRSLPDGCVGFGILFALR